MPPMDKYLRDLEKTGKKKSMAKEDRLVRQREAAIMNQRQREIAEQLRLQREAAQRRAREEAVQDRSEARQTKLRATNNSFMDAINRSRSPPPPPGPAPPMEKGGLIKQTGVYMLHKGEVVVPANRVKTVDMALKKDKKVPLKK